MALLKLAAAGGCFWLCRSPQHPLLLPPEVLSVLAASSPGNHSSCHRGSEIVKTLRKTDSRADRCSDCSSVLINMFFPYNFRSDAAEAWASNSPFRLLGSALPSPP